MNFLKNQKWRYATKKFDPQKTISNEHLEQLKEAVQLSVSSYGLQTYQVLIVQNKPLREKLRKVSWNQSQITEASHLFIFCNETYVNPLAIDDFLKLTSQIRNIPLETLHGYGDFMKAKLAEKSIEDQFHWSKNQTYIAMANLLAACAELKIDACPMEGFEAVAYNEILGLDSKGLNASVIVPIGYRSTDDHSQTAAKVRKPTEKLFVHI